MDGDPRADLREDQPHHVTEGNLVAIGNTLTTIVSQDPVYVYFDAPERVVLRWDKVASDQASGGLTTRARAFVGLLNEEGFPREGTSGFLGQRAQRGNRDAEDASRCAE